MNVKPISGGTYNTPKRAAIFTSYVSLSIYFRIYSNKNKLVYFIVHIYNMIIRVINKHIAHSKSRLKQDIQRPPEHLYLLSLLS